MLKLIKKLVLVLVLVFLSSASYAQVPHLINYQGRLTDKQSKPLEGSYKLTFRIYDDEASGTLLWEETHPTVVIQKGVFSILLGSVKDLGIPFDKQYFLEIKLGEEVLTPRQLIASSAYAIRAEVADNSEKLKGVEVSKVPEPNKLLVLNDNGQFPAEVVAMPKYYFEAAGSFSGNIIRNGPIRLPKKDYEHILTEFDMRGTEFTVFASGDLRKESDYGKASLRIRIDDKVLCNSQEVLRGYNGWESPPDLEHEIYYKYCSCAGKITGLSSDQHKIYLEIASRSYGGYTNEIDWRSVTIQVNSKE